VKKPASAASTWLKEAQEEQSIKAKVITDVVYTIFECKVHKVTIHYIKGSQTIENETPCWDCIRDANIGKK
jgi:hypothetical protein